MSVKKATTEYFRLSVNDEQGYNLDFPFNRIELTAFDQIFYGTPSYADGIVDDPVDISPVTTGRVLMIQTDQPISIRINGVANDSVDVERFFVLNTPSLTELHVSNASGNTAKLTIIVLGT